MASVKPPHYASCLEKRGYFFKFATNECLVVATCIQPSTVPLKIILCFVVPVNTAYLDLVTGSLVVTDTYDKNKQVLRECTIYVYVIH